MTFAARLPVVADNIIRLQVMEFELLDAIKGVINFKSDHHLIGIALIALRKVACDGFTK